MLATVYILLPQRQLGIDRQSYPDLVILLDTSRSMGESDVYQDASVLDRSKELGELVRKEMQQRPPEKIQALQTELAAKQPQAERDPETRAEVDNLQERLRYWEKQSEILNSTKWRPSRLQLVQALLSQQGTDWLPRLEVLSLDFGLLLSLYAGYRIALAQSSRLPQALRALAPWAVLMTLLFAAGIWLVFQPMQMRGTLQG